MMDGKAGNAFPGFQIESIHMKMSILSPHFSVSCVVWKQDIRLPYFQNSYFDYKP